MKIEQILSLQKNENNAYSIETIKYKFLLNKMSGKGMYVSIWNKEYQKTIGFYSMSSIVYIFENNWNSVKSMKRLFTDLVLKTPHRMKKIRNTFLKIIK